MTAIILPFPIGQRRGYIRRLAEQVACLNPISGANYISGQVRIQSGAMRRRGFSEDLIAREMANLERAIRREFLQLAIDG